MHHRIYSYNRVSANRHSGKNHGANTDTAAGPKSYCPFVRFAMRPNRNLSISKVVHRVANVHPVRDQNILFNISSCQALICTKRPM